MIALHIKAALQVTTGEILSGKRDPIFMKDEHKLAAYSLVYEVERAAAKKERKLQRRNNQVLGGTIGNTNMGLPSTQANEQGDLIVVIEDDDDDDDEDDYDDDDDDNKICNRSFGQILTRNLATMLLLEMTFPLMADSFLAKQIAQVRARCWCVLIRLFIETTQINDLRFPSRWLIRQVQLFYRQLISESSTLLLSGLLAAKKCRQKNELRIAFSRDRELDFTSVHRRLF